MCRNPRRCIGILQAFDIPDWNVRAPIGVGDANLRFYRVGPAAEQPQRIVMGSVGDTSSKIRKHPSCNCSMGFKKAR